MQKLIKNIPNITFFTTIILIYFGEVKLATLLAALLAYLTPLLIYDGEIPPLKQAYKHYGFFLLFIVIGFFQWGLALIGPAVFVASYLGYKYYKSSTVNKVFIGASMLMVIFLMATSTLPFLAQKQLHKTYNETVKPFKYFDLTTHSEVHSEDLRGKVVVLNFWATWCPTCVKELKPYSHAAEYFKNNPNVKFVAINAGGEGDTEEKIKYFLSKKSYTFVAAIDIDASYEFNVEALPSLVIIDKEGKLRVSHSGYSPAENLEEYLIKEVEKLL